MKTKTKQKIQLFATYKKHTSQAKLAIHPKCKDANQYSKSMWQKPSRSTKHISTNMPRQKVIRNEEGLHIGKGNDQ